jgi:hypothetical protein
VYGGPQHSQRSATPRGIVRYTWDDQYLYIGYVVYDDNLVARGNGELKGPAENRREGLGESTDALPTDRTEFFVVFADDHFFWELHHDAANHFSDIWVMVADPQWPIYQSTMAGRWKIAFMHQEYVDDQVDVDRATGERTAFRLATAVKLLPNSTVSADNARADKDQGYTAELRLPWHGIGAPAACRRGLKWDLHGQEIRLLAVTQNGEVPGCYHCSATGLPAGWFHHGVASFPRFRLADPAREPETKP